ncbi:hypothetical protein LKI01_25850 [Companilactobacillus paralimentarius]|uniref:Uncharacterized protein n=1 Tax=Companilactobacillus kimchii TaxID=2801452 RepID=A0A210P5V3_9LACO|nr:hypothetical protein ATN91_12790 [Companilactobacillus kimchii]OWF31852.1 hypothetical protein LKACC12383_02623 [Companilactobacillus kimchii]GEO48586.1 hypothetical protein LKI01_25850 [Companilactobacillus paralimentarius]
MKKNKDTIFYIIISLVLLTLYYLINKNGQTIYLLLFITIWLGFTVYGFYIIIKTFFKSKK